MLISAALLRSKFLSELIFSSMVCLYGINNLVKFDFDVSRSFSVEKKSAQCIPEKFIQPRIARPSLKTSRSLSGHHFAN